MTLFNAFTPDKSNDPGIQSLPSINGYGPTESETYRQDKRSVGQKSMDVVASLLTFRRFPCVKEFIKPHEKLIDLSMKRISVSTLFISSKSRSQDGLSLYGDNRLSISGQVGCSEEMVSNTYRFHHGNIRKSISSPEGRNCPGSASSYRSRELS